MVQLVDSLEDSNKYLWWRIFYKRIFFFWVTKGFRQKSIKTCGEEKRKRQCNLWSICISLISMCFSNLIIWSYSTHWNEMCKSYRQNLPYNFKLERDYKYIKFQSLFLEPNVNIILIFFIVIFFIYVPMFLSSTGFIPFWFNSYLCTSYSYPLLKSMIRVCNYFELQLELGDTFKYDVNY